ncbi:MAG: hypothetical protein NVSMB18_32350 [Acetobacteraceae bacterium]
MDILHAQALQARAAGQHERAIAAWRALLAKQPDDWRLALELKRDLKAGLHFPDSDPQFRRAARFLPDAEWFAHYPALYQFHGEDLEWLDQRAAAMLEATPESYLLHAIRGEVATQRRDWLGAERAFAAAHARQPENGEYAHKAAMARMYQRLAPVLERAPGGQGYAIAYVNLDRNAERAAEIARQFAGCAPPLHRIPGVEGGRLATSAVRRLGGDPAMRGTLGCFLSHAAAWEAMLERGDEVCLVVEDDVIPQLDLPPTLAGLGLPEDFELCFVNDRIAPPLEPSAVQGFTVHTLQDAMAAFHPDDNAPGGDGYLLSRAGASKLLDWVAADGFAEDVDWRLVAYGLSEAAIAALPRPSHAGSWLDRITTLVGRPERLAAYVLHPPLIRSVGVSSDREDENRLRPG